MRFLQTGDWHLGKVMHERSLLEDQKFFLEQIFDQLGKEKYNALLIPGDVYDKPVPSGEAVSLLSSFIGKVHHFFPELEIFILSGNHDSAERLSFLKDVLDEMHIHICTDTNDITEPVVIQNGTERTCVYQLPFLYDGSFRDNEDNSIRGQEQLYSYAAEKILRNHKENYSDCYSVLCAHLFTIQSQVSDSERSFIGTADQVSASLFEDFSYTAIGHLHSFQPCGKKGNIFYSGSPLAYSFDDSPEKFLLDVEIKGSSEKPEIKLEKIPVNPLHKVVRLKGKFSDFFGKKNENENDFVEVLLEDEVLPEGAATLLRETFPNLLSVRKDYQVSEDMTDQIQERKTAMDSRDPEKIFTQFFSEIYNGLENNMVDEEKTEFMKSASETGWGN